MYVNDPIADMLTRVRNANMIYSDSVDVPASKMKLAIARILKEEGYIRNFKTITDPKKPYASIRIFFSYGPDCERVIQGLRRISKRKSSWKHWRKKSPRGTPKPRSKLPMKKPPKRRKRKRPSTTPMGCRTT